MTDDLISPVAPVTVIIATYKRAHLIERALDSIAAQTLPPEHIIVVDDASNDDSHDVVQRWAERHARPVQFIAADKNGGVGVARNLAMARVTTPFVAFLDSDDAYLPHALERLLAPMIRFPDTVVSFADADLRWPDGQPSTNFVQRYLAPTRDATALAGYPEWYRLNDPQSTLLLTSMIPTCAAIFRLDAAKAVGLMPEYRHGEDWIFWLKLTRLGPFLLQFTDVAIVHRQGDNLTGAHHDARTAHQTLTAFLALKDGRFNVDLTDANKARLDMAIQAKAADLRYHASRKGMAHYWNVLGSPEARRVAGRWTQLLGDPKSFLRACYSSVTKSDQVTP